MRRFALPPVLALLVAAAGPASAGDGGAVAPGPLPVRDHFLLGVGFLALDPAPAEILETGRWQVEAIWSISNTWAISPQIDLALRARPERGPVTLDELEELARRSADGGSIFIDGEVSRTAIAVRRGLGGRTQLQLLVPLLSLHGGALDGPIERFHDALDLAEDGRGGAARDEFLVSLMTRRGTFLARDAPSFGLGDVVASATFRISGRGGTPFRAAVEASVKLPTASDEPLATSGEVDLGVQLLVGRSFRRWSLHGSAGVVSLGTSERLGLDSQRLVSGAIALERAFGRRSSLVVQVQASESPFQGLATSRIGRKAVQATIGVKRAIGARHRLFVAATDNFENFTNSSDLSLHLGLARSFG